MPDVESRKRITVFDLCNFLDEFIGDNARANSVEDRWLASAVQAMQVKAREIRNCRVEPDTRKAINEFRLSEIEKERLARQRDIDALDREASKLSKEHSNV